MTVRTSTCTRRTRRSSIGLSISLSAPGDGSMAQPLTTGTCGDPLTTTNLDRQSNTDRWNLDLRSSLLCWPLPFNRCASPVCCIGWLLVSSCSRQRHRPHSRTGPHFQTGQAHSGHTGSCSCFCPSVRRPPPPLQPRWRSSLCCPKQQQVRSVCRPGTPKELGSGV